MKSLFNKPPDGFGTIWQVDLLPSPSVDLGKELDRDPHLQAFSLSVVSHVRIDSLVSTTYVLCALYAQNAAAQDAGNIRRGLTETTIFGGSRMAGQVHITRRSALVGALALAAIRPVAGASAEPTLTDLLFAHDVATANLDLACNLADETHAQYDPAYAGFEAASQAEERARLAVLTYPCRSFADVRLKAAHFVKRLSPDCADFADEWAGKALVQSLLGVEA